MADELDELISQAIDAIQSAPDVRRLHDIKVYYLGKKGQFTLRLKTLAKRTADEQRVYGKKLNAVKADLARHIHQRKEQLDALLVQQRIADETIDVTLPVMDDPLAYGGSHPVIHLLGEMESLFASIGFDSIFSPEIESDYYNFAALNMPPHHPARAMHDSFYLDPTTVLRTHTSPAQVRAMETQPLPLRILSTGRVYRRDSDLTHTPMFHQVEGLWIDQQIAFCDLKGLLTEFVHILLKDRQLKTRFRPSYFPFTEPSAEMDIACPQCAQKKCRLCGYSGWIEVLGCGMVNPNVLQISGIDSHTYTGFAFGLGVERLAMLRYGVSDLRQFFDNDLRFLAQCRS